MNAKMKDQLLELLQDMMMGSHGSKLTPKAVSIDVVKVKPGEDLDDVLSKAQEDSPMDEMLDEEGMKRTGMSKEEWEESPEDEEMDEELEKCNGGKASLQEFFKKMRG